MLGKMRSLNLTLTTQSRRTASSSASYPPLFRTMSAKSFMDSRAGFEAEEAAGGMDVVEGRLHLHGVRIHGKEPPALRPTFASMA